MSARCFSFGKFSGAPKGFNNSNDREGKHIPTVKVTDILNCFGIKYKVVSNYSPDMKSDLMPAWYNALERKRALVSSYAYAFQDSFWWDERFYIFEMEFLKKGWFTIEGDDVEAVHLNHFVTENVLSQAYEYISDVLENPKQITAQEFMDFLDKTGLKQTADSHPGFLSLRE